MPKVKKPTKKTTKRVSNKSKITAIPAVKEIPPPVTPAYVTKEVSPPEYISNVTIETPYATTKQKKSDNLTLFLVGGIVILIMLAIFAL